jgi:hypothetical protein
MSSEQERMAQRPVGGLLTDLVSQVTALFRAEINLLKSEMNNNMRSIAGALVSVAIGAALLVAAMIALVQASVAVMVELGVSVWLASLIAGVVLALVGAIMIKGGANKMSLSEMSPERTVRQMEKDASLVKEVAK